MSSKLSVRIVESAGRAIAEAAAWWGLNRPKAPGAFAAELERALDLLAAQPHIGARARNVKLANVRRLHLARVRYHLYYRLPNPDTVEILALWHASRGTSPDLR